MSSNIDDESLRQYLPTSFGKQTKEANVAAQIDRTRRKAAPERVEVDGDEDGAQKPSLDNDDSDSNSDSNSDSDSDSDSEDEFPVSHELVLKTHDRAVTTITLDSSGSRMVTGSVDCTLKFHDFASMTPTTLRAFKSIDPTATKNSSSTEAHPIHQVEFCPLAPSQLLCISATSQAKILNRDGDTWTEFIKGDMYLRDMHNTKGHISEITSGTWHPTNMNLCVTASIDSTLRIWDVNQKRRQKDVIVYKSKAAGSAGRSRITAVTWGSPLQGGNNILVATALDGTMVMYSGEGPYSRPAGEIKNAHDPNTWTTGLDISPDGRLVVSRGGDNTIKLWDTRKFKSPITSVPHPSLSSEYPNENIKFSPSGTNILVGSPDGRLHILNPATLRPELVTPVTPGSPLVTVYWHSALNQIFTGSANAETHVLYNPKLSNKGAVLVMSRAPKRRHVDDDPNFTVDMSQGFSGDGIVNPNGLLATTSATSFAARHPTVGLTASGRSKDPRRPHIPQQTPFAKSQPDEKHIKEHIPLSSMRDEDPREALLKYAEKAEKEPIFTNAWKETQPKTIYTEVSDDDEEEGPDKKKTKR